MNRLDKKAEEAFNEAKFAEMNDEQKEIWIGGFCVGFLNAEEELVDKLSEIVSSWQNEIKGVEK